MFGSIQIHANPQDWDGYTELNPPLPPAKDSTTEENDMAEMANITGHWDERLTSFQKLILIKCFKEEKVRDINNQYHYILLSFSGCICSW